MLAAVLDLHLSKSAFSVVVDTKENIYLSLSCLAAMQKKNLQCRRRITDVLQAI